ncbi:MAG: NUDIX domain-containing protein [Corynebacteriales bacterium]|nr:NUDIX domain-containing protein [Mycobacteriales bacterium]
MSIEPQHIQVIVHDFLQQHPAASTHLTPLMSLLAAGGEVTSRHHRPGHVTCSAAVLDPDDNVLMIKHNILNRWLLPGGHCEEHDTTLLDAALRELTEETGLLPEQLSPSLEWEHAVIDIDLHNVPANPSRNEPAHWHADFRHMFRVDARIDIDLQLEEVSAAAWRPMPDTWLSRYLCP